MAGRSQSHGTGGLKFDPSKRRWPNEMNVFLALIISVVIFEVLGLLLMDQSFLFDSRGRFDSIFNEARLRIIILQVSIIGIIAIGVTQVIILGGIDLSSGSIVGATAMIAMSFAQVAEVNGNPNPTVALGAWVQDLPLIVPIIVGLLCGVVAGMGVMSELDAIAMAVIGGVSLTGGRGSIIGTVLGALIFGGIISGFTFPRLNAYYQKMVKGAIMGDNGVEQRTRGEIIFGGRPVHFENPMDARNAGIETVFQTLALADELDVPDNLFLGRELIKVKPGLFSILDYKAMRERTMQALEKTGVKIPNVRNTIRNMSGGQRQCVAIARTATFHSQLTIMDEPTAALGVQETAQVENVIRTLKDAAEPLILISHNMRQVFDLVDRVVVFRRGRICANLDIKANDISSEDVVAYITGAKTQPEYEDAAQIPDGRGPQTARAGRTIELTTQTV